MMELNEEVFKEKVKSHEKLFPFWEYIEEILNDMKGGRENE